MTILDIIGPALLGAVAWDACVAWRCRKAGLPTPPSPFDPIIAAIRRRTERLGKRATIDLTDDRAGDAFFDDIAARMRATNATAFVVVTAVRSANDPGSHTRALARTGSDSMATVAVGRLAVRVLRQGGMAEEVAFAMRQEVADDIAVMVRPPTARA